MIDDVRWMRRRLRAWGETHRRPFPWRSTGDPFRVLVAEVLLQRTRAEAVVPVYREVFRRWPTARRLAAAQVTSIASVIRPLGLRYRAPRLRDLARCVCSWSEVPKDVETLMRLPGVGRYAANATLAAAYGMGTPVVDRVSARVYRRFLGLPDDSLPASDGSLWTLVADITPRGIEREWNWAVLDLAASTCLPARPRCFLCPLSARCRYLKARQGVLAPQPRQCGARVARSHLLGQCEVDA